MPAPINVTPQMERVRAYADRALTMPEGLTLMFPNADYGGFQGASTASRAFQTTFCSLRTKVARRMRKHLGDITGARDSDIVGTYSNLACVRSRLPNEEGWKIELCKTYAIDMKIQVIDRATGLPVKDFDPQEQRLDHLIAAISEALTAATKNGGVFYTPLTESDRRFLWEYAPETARGIWEEMGAPIPDYAPGYVAPVKANGDYDVANVSVDEMFAKGEE